MALVPTDPQLDTRPPNYAKGQWFGGVPHSRVVLQQVGTWSLGFEAFNRGVLLGLGRVDFTDPNMGFAEWRGTYYVTPAIYAIVVYRWSVASETAGTCNFLVHDTFSLGAAELYGDIQLTNPVLPTPKVMPLSVRNPPIIQTPTEITKYDVPEWADVLERWPNVQNTDTF